MLVDRIQLLAKKQNMNLKDVAIKLGFSENAIYKWKTQNPKIENIEKIADYFNVTTDYLLGREDKKPYYELNSRDLKEIEHNMESLREDMANGKGVYYYGNPIDDEDMELILNALEIGMKIAKKKAKEKFTPKKYRN